MRGREVSLYDSNHFLVLLQVVVEVLGHVVFRLRLGPQFTYLFLHWLQRLSRLREEVGALFLARRGLVVETVASDLDEFSGGILDWEVYQSDLLGFIDLGVVDEFLEVAFQFLMVELGYGRSRSFVAEVGIALSSRYVRIHFVDVEGKEIVTGNIKALFGLQTVLFFMMETYGVLFLCLYLRLASKLELHVLGGLPDCRPLSLGHVDNVLDIHDFDVLFSLDWLEKPFLNNLQSRFFEVPINHLDEHRSVILLLKLGILLVALVKEEDFLLREYSVFVLGELLKHWVVEDFFGGRTVLGIFLKDFFEKRFAVLFQILVDDDGQVVHLVFNHVHHSPLVGRLSMQQFIEQHSELPNVDFEIVSDFVHDFGRHVLGSATDGHSDIFLLDEFGPSEVAELHGEVLVQEDVFGLDVSMGDFVLVEIGDCSDHTVEELEGESFWKALVLRN